MTTGRPIGVIVLRAVDIVLCEPEIVIISSMFVENEGAIGLFELIAGLPYTISGSEDDMLDEVLELADAISELLICFCTFEMVVCIEKSASVEEEIIVIIIDEVIESVTDETLIDDVIGSMLDSIIGVFVPICCLTVISNILGSSGIVMIIGSSDENCCVLTLGGLKTGTHAVMGPVGRRLSGWLGIINKV